ncbi:type I polyketide synthase [Pseudanabaena sp. ABRG5-3]|uniref:type I polyketide synthase n=1 Tax=Pseudanabaena sp. ABRG5-3 TaxID=685565 RepID=UPI000DC72C95|nr:type I polyketide synthase [Pseudanabaena sp. ABRG5-3]BBC27207.1 6-deoxyerythronolide-B synthase [Pseudanabaena sp. ABRG5-3]
MNSQETHQDPMLDIAIIGMACRVPGAKNIDEFWHNLRNGVESIKFFTDTELQSAGIAQKLLEKPNYVKAAPMLEDVDCLDAAFFGFSPREAELMDPQNRLFLESAWEALEHAGYNPQTYKGLIGVYGGSAINRYLLNNLIHVPNLDNPYGFSSEQDFLTTNVSYKLNLKGPSLNVQTFCSTSLVATHLAVQSLLNQECDIALAGGVTVHVPQQSGYIYHAGDITSPDGHCRTFDAKAQGTIFGSGVGIVVLKRLEDAIADGDHIEAVIKGSAINNDGSLKVSFTSPSVNGQVDVVVGALDVAGISADTISYIEAHGTATEMGDPIEIAALTQAFRRYTNKRRFCAIGTVKTNFGHLMAASGVSGLIKTVLALKHKQIPATLHFEKPNPKIDFDNSPFYVNSQLSEWKSDGLPRRAGISSLGFGGTNAHVVLEEAPELEASSASRPYQLLLLSAKTDTALETATKNLATHLKEHPEISLADVAYTLQIGRQTFDHRRMLVSNSLTNAVSILENPDLLQSQYQEFQNRGINFLFTGQGSQYVKMGEGLYQQESIFRSQLDRCSRILQPVIGLDLRDILYPSESQIDEMAVKLQETAIAQPAIFAIEYALAQQWIAWGIKPKAMLGHSLGEYVAACIAGVFSLEEALKLVAVRGKLMQALPKGKMLSISLPEAEIKPFLNKDIALAAINAPNLAVVSGTIEAIARLEQQLQELSIEYRQLHTSHAFHSAMMEPMLDDFRNEIEKIKLSVPKIPYISNVSGTWITEAQATDPEYWLEHIRQTVRFADGLGTLLQDQDSVLLEVGAGKTLSTLAMRHPARNPQQIVLTSLRHPQEQRADLEVLLRTLGQLWLAGVTIDWEAFYEDERRYRVPLPTYPFERQRFWIEPPKASSQDVLSQPVKPLTKKSLAISDWIYSPAWKSTVVPELKEVLPSLYLVFIDEVGLADKFIQKLEASQHQVITVKIGSNFAKLSDRHYTIDPNQAKDYESLIEALQQLKQLPDRIVHLWNVTEQISRKGEEAIATAQTIGLYSLLFLTQAIAKYAISSKLKLTVISNNMQLVTGQETIQPEKATLLGACKVIPQEYANIRCQSIDVALADTTDINNWQTQKLIDHIYADLTGNISEPVVAYRANRRWIQIYEPVNLEKSQSNSPRLKKGGSYLITGGLGSIGLILAEHLARTCQAKLVLVGRSPFPVQSEWQQWLATHSPEDPISQKIQKLQTITNLGSEVFIAKADVANLDQMLAVFAEVNQKWGAINGVIHAAGVLTEQAFQEIRTLDCPNCEQQLHPKVYGLLVLEQILRSQNIDFCLLFSSLSSVLGGLGYFAYSAANLFMDAFAQKQQQSNPTPWIAINWDSWLFQESSDLSNANNQDLGISPKQGMEVFQLILEQDSLNQVVVSTGNLHQRLNQWIYEHRLEQLDRKQPAIQEKANSALSVHSRPNLSNSYVAPQNEIEQRLANIWQDFLGISEIGIYDNFFELGGDSLLITRIISRLREVFQLELSHRDLFENPTLSGLGQIIESAKLQNMEPKLANSETAKLVEGEL